MVISTKRTEHYYVTGEVIEDFALVYKVMDSFSQFEKSDVKAVKISITTKYFVSPTKMP